MREFYRNISQYYHQLFPARQPQLDFLSALAGDPPARVVDVASGTGEYVAALCALGYDAYGVEIDFHMVAAAHLRHPEHERRLLHGDMLELMDELRGPCAVAFCIGNSLPHLARLSEVRDAVGQMWDVTAPAGKVALQVVNFDRVMNQAQPAGGEDGGFIFDLPSLSAAEAGGVVELDRHYLVSRRRESDSEEETPLFLEFASELRANGAMYQRSLRLLVLTRERLAACLPSAARVEWFGDYSFDAAWTADAPATICVLSR